LPYWVAELNGPHRLKARQLAESSGEAALLLWSVREQLHDVAWLLELTEELDPARAREEARALLALGELRLVRAALRLGLELPASLLECRDPEVRALAVAAGLADGDLGRALRGELPEVLAAIPRCPAETQLELLSDARWQVRAEAVRALGAGRERPLERVRELTSAESLGVQVAAVELLQRWGDAEWLEARWPT
jgi:hypothetical protein